MRPTEQKEIGNSCQGARKGWDPWSALHGSGEALLLLALLPSIFVLGTMISAICSSTVFLDILTVLEEEDGLALKMKW